MREILFRAKRIDNGEWVQGFYFCMVHDDGRHVHHFIMPLGADLNLGTPIEKIQVEVDVKTICQYTGLTDKNGNKIWENDLVLDSEEGELYKMVWCHDSMRYCVEKTGGFDYEFDSAYAISLEVIGNVFDNADLLKE